MKNFERWFFLILFFLTMGGVVGAVYYAQNTQLRKDIEARVAHLGQARAGVEAALKDLSAAQDDLKGVKGRVHTFEEVKVIQARMDKDQSDIQTYTAEILGDVNFLQGQWSALTQEERDFVTQARQDLG